MRVLQTAIALAVVLATGSQARAAFIVDTGTPASVNGGASLYSAQDLAGEFSISGSYSINSIEGFIAKSSSSGNVVISIHADGGIIPGTILYSATMAPSAPSSAKWQGAFGLDWALSTGTYWVSFVATGGFDGYMPTNAPNPLSSSAWRASDEIWRNGFPSGIGVRIDASQAVSDVPAPASLILWSMGGGLAFFGQKLRRRRKTTTEQAA